ncbi:MAG TPA: hypothetical protein PKU94_06430 [Candidatus Hydrothermia bacterium]|nr:hypothetical protein [Candidatus Hydrothermia bacterium]
MEWKVNEEYIKKLNDAVEVLYDKREVIEYLIGQEKTVGGVRELLALYDDVIALMRAMSDLNNNAYSVED